MTEPMVVTPQLVPVESIQPSPVQSRKTFDTAKIEELAESIRAQGLLQPILVRPHNGSYELVFGERRLRACKYVGWSAIPALVQALSDQEAHEKTVVENLEREDLTPFEESRAVQVLLEGEGATLESVADRLGRPKGWVAKRAKLTNLSKKWLQKVQDEEAAISRWSAGLLEQVARLLPKHQDDLLQAGAFRWEVPSRADLQSTIERQIFGKLSSALWKLDDAELVKKAGACLDCEKRSTCQPDLFDDLTQTAEGFCLDPECWGRKGSAHRDRRFGELIERHPKLKTVNEGGGYFGSGSKQKKPWTPEMDKRLVNGYDYRYCKKTAEGAEPILVVHGASPGQLRWMKPISRGAQTRSKVSAPKSLKERRVALQTRRHKAFDVRTLEALQRLSKKPDDNWITKQPAYKALCAVFVFGCHDCSHEDFWSDAELWKRLDERLASKDPDDLNLEMLQHDLLYGVISIWSEQVRADISLGRSDARIAHKVLGYFGFNLASIEADIAEKIPEPKSWKGLNADGTPKKKPALKGADKKKGATKKVPPARKPKAVPGVCKKCGCTEEKPCQDPDTPTGTCGWANKARTLCTACAKKKAKPR